MSSKLIPDALWQEIEGLFPAYVPCEEGGRPPKDARLVLTAVLFALRFDIPWRELPSDLGCSYKTCLRRLRAWTAVGLWTRIHHLLLARLRGAEGLDWSRVQVDATYVKAPRGGPKQVPIPRTVVARAVSCT